MHSRHHFTGFEVNNISLFERLVRLTPADNRYFKHGEEIDGGKWGMGNGKRKKLWQRIFDGAAEASEHSPNLLGQTQDLFSLNGGNKLQFDSEQHLRFKFCE